MTNPIGATRTTSTQAKYQTPKNRLQETWAEPVATTMAQLKAQQTQPLRIPNLSAMGKLLTNANTEAPQHQLPTATSQLLKPANKNRQLTAEVPTDKLLQEYDNSLRTLAAENYANLQALIQSHEAILSELREDIQAKVDASSNELLEPHKESVRKAEQALIDEQENLRATHEDILRVEEGKLLKEHEAAVQAIQEKHEEAVLAANRAYHSQKGQAEQIAERVNNKSTALLPKLPPEDESARPNSFQDSITAVEVLKKNLLPSAKPPSNNSTKLTTPSGQTNNKGLAEAAKSMLTPRTKTAIASPTNNETSASKPTIESIKAEITDSKFISAEDKKQRHSLIDDFNGMLIGAKKEEAFSHLGKMISTGDGVLASKLTKLWNTAHPENLIG